VRDDALTRLRRYVERAVMDAGEPLRPARILGLVAEAECEQLATTKALYDEIKDHTRTRMDGKSV
jgi:hypothetical protein